MVQLLIKHTQGFSIQASRDCLFFRALSSKLQLLYWSQILISVSSTQQSHPVCLGLHLPVPWSGKCPYTESTENMGLTSLFSHIPVLHFVQCLKIDVLHILFSFIAIYGECYAILDKNRSLFLFFNPPPLLLPLVSSLVQKG